MAETERLQIAIVDYGMGNLFSVKNACLYAGLNASITSSSEEIIEADAVILPGVGAFGDAMENLRLGLVSAIHEVAAMSKPLIGICLGMQLLMTESCEFGYQKGLGIIPGTVEPLARDIGLNNRLKVPHVYWSRVFPAGIKEDAWSGTILEVQPDGVYMYFVHSYYVRPDSKEAIIAVTHYGDLEFCSAFKYGSIFACQFHPERSGPDGLAVYKNIPKWISIANTNRGENG